MEYRYYANKNFTQILRESEQIIEFAYHGCEDWRAYQKRISFEGSLLWEIEQGIYTEITEAQAEEKMREWKANPLPQRPRMSPKEIKRRLNARAGECMMFLDD